MTIAINCRFLISGKLEGIGNYTLETAKRIVLAHPEHHFILLFDRPFSEEFVWADNCTPVVISPPARHPFLWYIWFEWRIPFVLKKYKVDAFYSPDSYMSLRSSVPTTLIVHDLAYLHYPEAIPSLVRHYYQYFFPKFITKAKNIGVVSKFVIEDIQNQYSDIDTQSKIEYAPCAADKIFHPLDTKEKQELRDQYTDGQEYFLFVGAIHPRKNLIALLRAFKKFKDFYSSSFRLVIVGRKAWMSDAFDTYLEAHPYREDIVYLDHSDRILLSRLYASAYALVYPSLFEGFGMPVLESIQSGVPVIVSDRTSLPEVAGEAGIICNPEDVNDIAQKMGMIYKDENLYNQLKSKCPEQASKYSWDRTAETIWGLIIAHIEH